MGKFVYIYYVSAESEGGSGEAWGKWFGELGANLVDPGNPFGHDGTAVFAGGTMPVADKPATGYSIVNAASKDEAIEWAKSCPLMSEPDGAVCVYEALPM